MVTLTESQLKRLVKNILKESADTDYMRGELQGMFGSDGIPSEYEDLMYQMDQDEEVFNYIRDDIQDGTCDETIHSVLDNNGTIDDVARQLMDDYDLYVPRSQERYYIEGLKRHIKDRIGEGDVNQLALDLNEQDSRDQWAAEARAFMKGLKNGQAFECGDRCIAVEWKGYSDPTDPRYIVFEYGDNRLRDDHFYMQHSPVLSVNNLKEIRDYMDRMGMVSKDEFDMDYNLYDESEVYEAKLQKAVRNSLKRLLK